MIKMADTCKPLGQFPVAEAEDIDFADGESLQKKLDDGSLGGGSGSWVGTREDFEALDKSTLKDGQQLNFTDDYNKSVINDSKTSGVSTWSSQKISDELGELGNIPKLTNFDNAIPEVGKTKVYYVNSGIGFGIVGQWRVESTLYDVTGNNQVRGYQRATSMDGVNVSEAIRVFYVDDLSRELKFGAWKQLI